MTLYHFEKDDLDLLQRQSSYLDDTPQYLRKIPAMMHRLNIRDTSPDKAPPTIELRRHQESESRDVTQGRYRQS